MSQFYYISFIYPCVFNYYISFINLTHLHLSHRAGERRERVQQDADEEGPLKQKPFMVVAGGAVAHTAHCIRHVNRQCPDTSHAGRLSRLAGGVFVVAPAG